MASRVKAPRTTVTCSKQSPPSRRIASLRPRPGRRRSTLLPSAFTFIFCIILLAFTSTTIALDQPRYQLKRPRLEQWENDIVFDGRQPPHDELRKRQFDIGDSSSKTRTTTSVTEISAPTNTAEASRSAKKEGEATQTGGIITAPTPLGSNLPQAFDAGLGTNYTQNSCSTFLRKMLDDQAFTKCLPVSLLLQNSQAFFSASRSAGTLTPLLSASCNVDQRTCSPLMSSYALSLRSSNACSQDYDRQQPTVRQAYNGLVAYDLLYRSVCTKAIPTPQNNNSADFCYTNAVTNLSSPTDAYIYYLPLGISLPATALPSCTQCLKQTMGTFGPMARNKSQPISLTYASAAQQVNLNCGPDFVSQSVAGAGSAGTMVLPRVATLVSATAIVVASQLLRLL